MTLFGITKKDERELRRKMTAENTYRKVRARCNGILRTQIVRAKKLNLAPPDYTIDQLVQFVVNALSVDSSPTEGKCHYCRKKLTATNFSLDHPIALDRGGTFAFTNIDVIDDSCNQKKGKLSNSEFNSLLGFISQFDKVAQADILTRLGIGGQWKH